MRKSIWGATSGSRQFPVIRENLEADVIVVGAGITGLTAAYMLSSNGRSVIVLEAGSLDETATVMSSAHLTTESDYYYSKIISKHGNDTARMVAESRRAAISFISGMSGEIPCDFEYVPGYLYSEHDAGSLDREYEAASASGLEVRMVKELQLPFRVLRAIEFPDQAVFNPGNYLAGLAASLTKTGSCRIFEKSRVTSREKNTLKTGEGSVTAGEVIYASHYPVFTDLHQTLAYAYRSYMLAVQAEEEIGQALYWDDADPYHYTRRYEHDGKRYLVIGGGDHKTGETDRDSYKDLEKYIRERFTVRSVDFRWSSQYYEPADGLPFIGKSYSGSEYIGTAYSGDGLVYGTLAGMLISNEILGTDHQDYGKIYSSRRIKPVRSAKKFVSENVSVAGHMIGDRVNADSGQELEDLPNGEGRVIKEDGKFLAVSRDSEGRLHRLSAVCPHLKCIVLWNRLEQTWDCPCHGSRFSMTGKVMNGPAVRDLKVMHPVRQK